MIGSLGGRTVVAHRAPGVFLPKRKGLADIGAGLPVYRESFDQADATVLGPDLTWVAHNPASTTTPANNSTLTYMRTVGDTLSCFGTGDSAASPPGSRDRVVRGTAYADVALPTGDMYTQIEVAATDDGVSPNDHQLFGIGARCPDDAGLIATSNYNGFFLNVFRNYSGGWGDWYLVLDALGSYRDDGNTYAPTALTEAVSLGAALTPGDVFRIEVTGPARSESVRALYNGAEQATMSTAASGFNGVNTPITQLVDTYGRYGWVKFDEVGRITFGGLALDNFEVGALP